MSLNLRDLAVGDTGKIISLQKGNKAYRAKLLAMGLLPGTEFRVTRYAPMGDPVEIRVRDFSLSLRKDEADVLLVDKL
jgi:ferrous iron transport protein A